MTIDRLLLRPIEKRFLEVKGYKIIQDKITGLYIIEGHGNKYYAEQTQYANRRYLYMNIVLKVR